MMLSCSRGSHGRARPGQGPRCPGHRRAYDRLVFRSKRRACPLRCRDLMLLVDGNNVSSPRRPWHPMDRGSRRRLVADVARLTHEWPICADVVFDGFPREGLRHGEVLAAVRVWFAAHQTADDWILARAPEHPPGELLSSPPTGASCGASCRAAHGSSRARHCAAASIPRALPCMQAGPPSDPLHMARTRFSRWIGTRPPVNPGWINHPEVSGRIDARVGRAPLAWSPSRTRSHASRRAFLAPAGPGQPDLGGGLRSTSIGTMSASDTCSSTRTFQSAPTASQSR